MIYNIPYGFGASYDSTSSQYYNTTGETTYHNFSGLGNITTDTIFITVTLNGDYTSYSSEYAILNIEGTSFGQINNYNISDGTDYIASYYFTEPYISNWLADGILNVQIINSSGVNPGYGQQLNKVQLSIPGVQWIEIPSFTDTLTSGDSANVSVKVNALGMYSGIYNSSIVINSNDPSTPVLTVPSKLTINAPPKITSSVNCVDFGSITQNTTVKDTILIFSGLI